MPPDQTPQQNQEDPYGFITNPQKPAKRKLSFNFGNTPQQKAIIVGVGFVLLIIVFMILLSVFNRASNAQKDRLVRMAQAQAEIARVAELANKDARGSDTRALAVNVQLTLESDLQETKELLAKRGIELKDKTIAQNKDESTDKELEQAASDGRFDEVLRSTIEDQLGEYKVLVRSAYNGGGKLDKQVLQQNFDDLALLR